MTKLSEEQIMQARDVALLDYLQTHEPGSVRKCGADEYCLVAHDSFKLSNGKWFWFSQGYGGHSALDYLIKVREVDFVDAVETLISGTVVIAQAKKVLPKINSPPKPQKPFTLPKANTNNDRVCFG